LKVPAATTAPSSFLNARGAYASAEASARPRRSLGEGGPPPLARARRLRASRGPQALPARPSGINRRLLGPTIGIVLIILVGPAGAQIIDRVLAVVDGSPITLSDVNAAVRFGFVAVPARQPDADRAALDAVIDRRLQLIEVNRYLPPEPTAAAIDARLAETRTRFASEDAFQAALKETGMSLPDLRAAVRDSLRIASYLAQRFRAGYQPGEDEVLAYYRSHQADFDRGGVVRPFAEARDDARQRLIESRTDALIRDWIAALRRRVDVTLLPK
jgi:hypothetical protein